MAKTTQELLDEIASEASDVRDDNASVKSGIVKQGEDVEPSHEADETEQDIDSEDEPDEESEETKEPEEPKESKEDTRQRNKENALRRMLQKEQETRAELERKVQEFQEASTKAKQKEIGDEISELAGELNLDPDGLGKIFNKFETIIERKFQAKLPPEEIVKDFEKRQEQEYFDNEWKDEKVQKYLADTYPNATAKQLDEAKALLDEISHSEDGGRVIVEDGKERLAGYPLEYLMWANKEDFDSILSSKKRHGLESANRAGMDSVDEDTDTSSAKGIDNLDKKYSNIAADDSGLHRVRPSQRGI